MPSKTTYPGVHIEELPSQIRTITGVSTSVAAFIDFVKKGPMNKAVHISSMGDFDREFGGIDTRSEASYAVQQFFLNGGSEAWIIRVSRAEPDELKIDAKVLIGDSTPTKTGLHALDDVDLFNILCIPRIVELSDSDAVKVITFACSYCEKRRAFFIVDTPKTCNNVQKIQDWLDGNSAVRHKNAALYFPRVSIIDPLNDFKLRSIGASGMIAGLYARIDRTKGVWKAPSGLEAGLAGALDLSVKLTDYENGDLNAEGINCLRVFPNMEAVAWGSRTLVGVDTLTDEWKYISVRRTALFVEESLYRGTQWVVFEPNDEPLWSQIRLNVTTFMHGLFRQEAFQGRTPAEAYFVKCDKETITQDDINKGIVNFIVGFAPLKPAEFVVIKIQQHASS